MGPAASHLQPSRGERRQFHAAGCPWRCDCTGFDFLDLRNTIRAFLAVQANSFPLGTTLANVSITVTQGGTAVNAIPLFVSASQINAIMPSNAPLGTVTLRV